MVSSFGETFREPNLKLFVRDVREGKKRPIEVRSWSTIQNVKEILQRKIQVPTSSIRLFFGPLLTSGQELPNHRTLHDVGIYRSGETILLDIKNSADRAAPPLNSSKSSVDIQISASMMESTPKALRALVTQARRGLSLGFKPDLVLDGSGGTYILHDPCKRNIAVFKPSDEEPYAANNPRGYLRQPKDSSMALRAGVTPGEACMREVAAYFLDKDGFSGVPQTTLVEARHPTFNTNGARLNVSQGGASLGAHSIAPLSPVKPSPVANKAGSFQEFVNCECTIDDISPSMISAKEVHKIAILDIRIMNSDRNSANLLVRRRRNNALELVPIDHGFCLRSVCDVCWMDWCWLDWPQLKEPLCDDHKTYIMGLDVESEARMLRDQLNICEEAVDYFRASSALLKAGVAAGLSLYEIAIKCCRNDNLAEVPSMMEKLFDMASDLAQVAVQNDRYHHSTASRALVDQLSPSAEALWHIKPPARPASRRFGRSVSNAELESSHSTNSDRSLYKHQELAEEEPDMAHSSVSDSCSETEVNDHTNEDECNKWAGKIIADLSEPWSATRTHRASSIASSDASVLSSSPGGFWTIPPGTVDLKTSDEDDSVQWSPRSNEPRCQATGFENVEPPPLTIGDAAKSVTFSDTDFPFMLPDSLEPLQPKAVVFADTDAIPDAKASCTTPGATSNMKRSKSYTAMPAGGPRKTDIPVAQRGPDKFSVQYTQYKKYFHNFIDLVIVQETTSALGRS